jgi:hypothetical protein
MADDTRIVVLDISTLPNTIKVVTQEDVQGSFRDARSIGNNHSSRYVFLHQLLYCWLVHYIVTTLEFPRLEWHRHTRQLPTKIAYSH